MSSTDKSLDVILAELGDFGRYQRRNFALICLAVIYTAIHLNYVFTSRDLNYRCKVEECDTNPEHFNPLWLAYAVPLENGHPVKCEKFKYISDTNQTTCSSSAFDKNQTESCDSFIYETSETTIVNDFDIHCKDNLWKLTMVGTINNIGHFLCLPFAGFISDRFGRRTLLVGGLVLSSMAGLARSFAPSYLWFLLLEFLDTFFGSGSFSCAFILGVELVGPTRRVLIGTILSCAFTLGETFLALIAWYAQSWRLFLRIVYPPGILIILYLWLTPESIRWSLAKGKTDDAVYVLRKAATVNGKTLSFNALEKLGTKEEKETTETKSYPILRVLRSLTIMLRLMACSFCWICGTFLFYGLSLNSVALSGNLYINFIMTVLIEIPAFFVTYIIMDRIGRRTSQFLSFIGTGCACFAFMYIPEEKAIIKLSVYLIGKFAASIAFTVVYVFTTELFPTSLRHSLLATCSMLGRVGSMVAPQTPILAQIWHHLPLVLFGSMATAAGFLSLTFPETMNIKLPDTIEEAEAIGKKDCKEKDLKNNCV